jgi:hypothetical protein
MFGHFDEFMQLEGNITRYLAWFRNILNGTENTILWKGVNSPYRAFDIYLHKLNLLS